MSTENPNVSFNEKMEAMKQSYRTWIGEKLAELAQLEAQFQLHPTPETVTALIALAHRMAGSGATFGFPDISETGRELEEKLEEGERRAEVIMALIKALKEACRKVSDR